MNASTLRDGIALLGAGLLLHSCVACAQVHASAAASGPVARVYARPAGVDLKVHVFSSEQVGARQRRPAIVLFHGGGWSIGTPEWAFSRARHFAERGMVAVAAQYRLSDGGATTPLEAMADARTAIRWVRHHADSLGIDPGRIAAYGWSAGAHLAVSAAMFDEGQPGQEISGAPNALVLVSPAVALGADRHVQRLLGPRARAHDISPDEHVRKGLPPTLILQGSVDTVTPLKGVERFCERMRAAGNACEIHVYEGFGHLFTPAGIPDDGWPRPDSSKAEDALARADRFLRSLGFQR